MSPYRLARAGALLLIVCAFTVNASQEHRVGKPRGAGSFIEWELAITGHDLVQLTVISPDGQSVTREFSGGRNPSLRLSDLPSTVDGQYDWELIVVPRVPEHVRRKLAEARAADDDAKVRKTQREAGLDRTLTQSGAFMILNGAIVATDAVESGANAGASGVASHSTSGRPSLTPRTNDSLVPDDLIVQGSGCIGFDCLDGESFGFDTLRLKENNLRIHFEDTSSSSGFPANDWRLVGNDSNSGGANKFSIEDGTAARTPFTIKAGAPESALVVSPEGFLGVSTATPTRHLHMTASDTPTVRMQQTNTGGFTAQTWDIGANEANFFVRDLTGGSTLPFRIRPGAPTSSVDISARGWVGIGTNVPASKLHVIGDIVDGALMRVQNMNATGYSGVSFFDPAGDARGFFGFDNGQATTRIASFRNAPIVLVANNVERMRVTASGAVGVGTTTPATGSRLHVNGGDLRVSGGNIITDAGTVAVPDYVFEPSYELMPIGVLAQFVRDEKHLPNIPPAAEVKSNGVNLTEMQMKLLEKIEELTLYTIAQQEELNALRARLTELEKKQDVLR